MAQHTGTPSSTFESEYDTENYIPNGTKQVCGTKMQQATFASTRNDLHGQNNGYAQQKTEKATRKYARTIIAEMQKLTTKIKELNQATQMLAKHRQNGDETQESENKAMAKEYIDNNKVIEH